MRILTFVCVWLSLSVAPSIAHPPTSVTAVYDLESQVVMIDGKHKTDDPDEDYLKKMVFFVNGEDVKVEYFQRQKSRAKFAADVSLAAEEGDTIEVKIYSAEGGSKTVSVSVDAKAEEGDVEAKEEKVAQDEEEGEKELSAMEIFKRKRVMGNAAEDYKGSR